MVRLCVLWRVVACYGSRVGLRPVMVCLGWVRSVVVRFVVAVVDRSGMLFLGVLLLASAWVGSRGVVMLGLLRRVKFWHGPSGQSRSVSLCRVGDGLAVAR